MAEKLLRVQLDLSEVRFSPHKCVLVPVPVSAYCAYLRTIGDFKVLLNKKFSFLRETNFQLFINDSLLPEDETIFLLRDNDILKVLCEDNLPIRDVGHRERNFDSGIDISINAENATSLHNKNSNGFSPEHVHQKKHKSKKCKKDKMSPLHFQGSASYIPSNETVQKSMKRKSSVLETETVKPVEVVAIESSENSDSLSPSLRKNKKQKSDASYKETPGKATETSKNDEITVENEQTIYLTASEEMNSIDSINATAEPKSDASKAVIMSPLESNKSKKRKRKRCRKRKPVINDSAQNVLSNFSEIEQNSSFNSSVGVNRRIIFTDNDSNVCAETDINLDSSKDSLDIDQTFTVNTTDTATNPKKSAKRTSSNDVAEEAEKISKFSYDDLKPLDSFPTIGTKIAYKILELSNAYCPEVSDYKEGIVKDVDHATEDIEIELIEEEIKNGRTGKFENLKPDEEPPVEIIKNVTVNWSALIDPKLFC